VIDESVDLTFEIARQTVVLEQYLHPRVEPSLWPKVC
jgi:hypothetical protein